MSFAVYNSVRKSVFAAAELCECVLTFFAGMRSRPLCNSQLGVIIQLFTAFPTKYFTILMVQSSSIVISEQNKHWWNSKDYGAQILRSESGCVRLSTYHSPSCFPLTTTTATTSTTTLRKQQRLQQQRRGRVGNQRWLFDLPQFGEKK